MLQNKLCVSKLEWNAFCRLFFFSVPNERKKIIVDSMWTCPSFSKCWHLLFLCNCTSNNYYCLRTQRLTSSTQMTNNKSFFFPSCRKQKILFMHNMKQFGFCFRKNKKLCDWPAVLLFNIIVTCFKVLWIFIFQYCYWHFLTKTQSLCFSRFLLLLFISPN